MRAWMCDRCEAVERPVHPASGQHRNKRPDKWGTVRLTVSPDGDPEGWLICPACQEEFRSMMGDPVGEDFE